MGRGRSRVGLCWLGGCGGCEVALLDAGERLIDVERVAEILFWPAAVDSRYEELAGLGDGTLDLSIVSGCVRNSDHRHIAEILRSKSRFIAAFGSCACFGGIPGLANLHDRESLLAAVCIYPFPEPERNGLSLPEFCFLAERLQDVVDVDWFVPGCPPGMEWVLKVLEAMEPGTGLPAGAALAGESTVCRSCPRTRGEKGTPPFRRIHEVLPDPSKCFLEQGIICCGAATRDGCGTRCLNAGMPCRGCYGPPPGVPDQGAAMVGAISALIENRDPDEIGRVAGGIIDPVGYFYRFSLPSSLLRAADRARPVEGISNGREGRFRGREGWCKK